MNTQKISEAVTEIASQGAPVAAITKRDLPDTFPHRSDFIGRHRVELRDAMREAGMAKLQEIVEREQVPVQPKAAG